MQAALTYIGTRKSIHAKRNMIKRLQMSKEREAALRGAHKARATTDPVMDNADMEGTGLEWRNALPPSFRSEHEKKWSTPPEDNAMHALWNSERRINLNGQWYVPLTEVAATLDTAPTEDPTSEEWQAQTFPNLNIGSGMGEPINAGKPTPEEDSKRWIRIPKRFKQETRLRIPDRY